MPDDVATRQRNVCASHSAEYTPPNPRLMAGVSRNFDSGEGPLHGLRHPPVGDSTGWFLWAGEYLGADDFFEPVHMEHVLESSAGIADYLALPPGWRFRVAGDDVDVWFDESLFDV